MFSISIIIFCLYWSWVIFVKNPGLFLIFNLRLLPRFCITCTLLLNSANFNWASISLIWKLSIIDFIIFSSSFPLFNNSTINASILSISLKFATLLYLIMIPFFNSPITTLNTLDTHPNKLSILIFFSIDI